MERIPLDELEVKIQLLKQEVDISNYTSTQICKLIQSNFNVDCDELDLFLLDTPKNINPVDEAIITYKDIL